MLLQVLPVPHWLLVGHVGRDVGRRNCHQHPRSGFRGAGASTNGSKDRSTNATTISIHGGFILQV